MWPPIKVVTQCLKLQTRTNMSAMFCKWSRGGDSFMTLSWLSHDCIMTITWLPHDCLMTVSWQLYDCLRTQKELFRIWWAMGQCHVGPCSFRWITKSLAVENQKIWKSGGYVIDQVTARLNSYGWPINKAAVGLKSGSCLIDQAAARLKSAAWLVRNLVCDKSTK